VKLPKFNRAQVPTMAGRASSTSHILGTNPRKGKFSMGAGTNLKLHGGNQIGDEDRRSEGGTSQSTAPYKHGFKPFNFAISKALQPK
jgi:hypothetical protein